MSAASAAARFARPASPTTLALVLSLTAACSCQSEREQQQPAPGASGSAAARAPAEPAPEVLYLPDGGDVPAPVPEQNAVLQPVPVRPGQRCPPEMVDVAGAFCIDRYEASLFDTTTSRALSPYYHPTRYAVRRELERWQRRRLDARTEAGRRAAVPAPPAFQLDQPFEPKAASLPGVVPAGYLSGVVAERACLNANKRLCRAAEWVTACRGELKRKFPYGETYRRGACNIDREAHPAAVLHGNASIHHLDPRLNQVEGEAGPLLRPTGATPECVSAWGTDGVFDMVGNLDEWVEDDGGAFHGGFYARATHEGCDARISSHAREYYDYSLGVRCCR